MPTLETPGLILRDITEADFSAIHSYGGNIDNVKYMAWGPNSEEGTRGFIARAVEMAQAEPRVNYDFAMILKSTGQLIGTGGIYLEMDWHGRRFIAGNLGWILHMDYWKQGYCTEFAAALLRFGFEELGLHRIRSSCDAENYGSYRVMERNGMRREAAQKEAILSRDGKWHDQYEYAILREEWMLGHAY
ncbi:MAG: GNAT family N-acetyltransferase [Oscillospiraceae bacterium]|nr:GNAT family N-acetyltransferase [Oscillospiraceae bacterium]